MFGRQNTEQRTKTVFSKNTYDEFIPNPRNQINHFEKVKHVFIIKKLVEDPFINNCFKKNPILVKMDGFFFYVTILSISILIIYFTQLIKKSMSNILGSE
jgi:hypothetical protein